MRIINKIMKFKTTKHDGNRDKYIRRKALHNKYKNHIVKGYYWCDEANHYKYQNDFKARKKFYKHIAKRKVRYLRDENLGYKKSNNYRRQYNIYNRILEN